MKVEQDVLAVLSRCAMTGDRLQIAGQLDRKMYEKVNKVLEAAGGRWNRGAKAHIFPGEAADIIDAVIISGEIATAQEFGVFFTPPAVVAQMIRLAEIKQGMRVLEPSAGVGNIARELAKMAKVECIEILPKHAEALCQSGLYEAVLCMDFLQTSPVPSFDRVVMNPPFAKQADIDHVTHALKFLKPGGRLVTVMSAGVMFRENRKTLDFTEMVNGCGGDFLKLPENAFKESGTGVNTVLAVIPAPLNESKTGGDSNASKGRRVGTLARA